MRREGARLPLLGVPLEMGRVHRALLAARLPVLWLVVAGVAARIAWHLEDPMLRRP
jgi:hypothetical protein